MKAFNKIVFCLWISCASVLMGCAQTTPDCAYKGGAVDFLSTIHCNSDFLALQNKPLSQNYGDIQSIKLVYDIHTAKVYFINSYKYRYHYDFCAAFLRTYNDLSNFNQVEYNDSPHRKYVLANLNHYDASDIYTLELFADDHCPSHLVIDLFEQVKKNTFFGDKIRLLNSTEQSQRIIDDAKGLVPFVSVDEIYGKQIFQPMIIAGRYGYLRKVEQAAFDTFPFQKHDIIVTNFLPNNFPYCQGIITSTFQTPLCHINILSHNRITPNCAYKFAMTDQLIDAYLNQLVYYEVTDDTFIIHPAELKEVELYWANQEKKKHQKLTANTNVKTLVDIKEMGIHSVAIVGGKAANFGELAKIKMPDNTGIPLPEAAFAIPFYFYDQHILANGLQPLIDHILSNSALKNNRTLLEKELQKLQDTIKHTAIDPVFLSMVETRLKANGMYTEYRFRSSTNAEDVVGFNGAGLYESKTGSLVNPKKTVEEAIKKVWASVWNIRAFEEREAMGIDQATVAMGILVHRAFGDEEANGVAITKDLYRMNYPSFTINVQKGETSVVLPQDSSVCDQLLVKFSGTFNNTNTIAIEYISHSSLNHFQPVMTRPEIEKLTTYLQAIKRHFYNQLGMEFKGTEYDNFAMDVEFKLEKNTRKIYIKQARTY